MEFSRMENHHQLQTLQENHQVLSSGYCSGFHDENGAWTAGFDCASTDAQINVYCCGSATTKYCCVVSSSENLSPPIFNESPEVIPYNYDYYEGHESYETVDAFSSPPSVDTPKWNKNDMDPTLILDLSKHGILVGIVAGVLAMIILMTILSCFYCSCCIVYKKRRSRQSSNWYALPTSWNSWGMDRSGFSSQQSSTIAESVGGFDRSLLSSNPTSHHMYPVSFDGSNRNNDQGRMDAFNLTSGLLRPPPGVETGPTSFNNDREHDRRVLDSLLYRYLIRQDFNNTFVPPPAYDEIYNTNHSPADPAISIASIPPGPSTAPPNPSSSSHYRVCPVDERRASGQRRHQLNVAVNHNNIPRVANIRTLSSVSTSRSNQQQPPGERPWNSSNGSLSSKTLATNTPLSLSRDIERTSSCGKYGNQVKPIDYISKPRRYVNDSSNTFASKVPPPFITRRDSPKQSNILNINKNSGRLFKHSNSDLSTSSSTMCPKNSDHNRDTVD